MTVKCAVPSSDNRLLSSVAGLFIAIFLVLSFPAFGRSENGGNSAANPPEGSFTIDDFSGAAFDPAKWTVTTDKAGTEVFSLSGGRLSFSVTAGGGTLQATKCFGAGFYSMQFFNFSSTNDEEPGSHRGAFVGLCLGPKDNFVRVIRCQNGNKRVRKGESPYIGVFEANYIDNAKGGIQVHYLRTEVSAGRLGLYFDGSKVSFYFNSDPYSDKGWQTMKDSGRKALQWDPHWTEPPKLFIRCWDPSGRTKAQLGNIEYRAAPPEAR